MRSGNENGKFRNFVISLEVSHGAYLNSKLANKNCATRATPKRVFLFFFPVRQ